MHKFINIGANELARRIGPNMKQALILTLCILTIAAGCAKNANLDASPAAETFRLEESCEVQETCCTEKCNEYCISEGGVYQDHLVNGQTCACFCSEG
jgi:hypothetical protein